MKSWKLDLNQKVNLILSGEYGTVIGRAEYLNDADRYLVRYKAADGRLVEGWWPGEALIAE